MLENTDPILTDILLFGDASLNRSCNTHITNATTEYILSSIRIEEPHFKFCRDFLTLDKLHDIQTFITFLLRLYYMLYYILS